MDILVKNQILLKWNNSVFLCKKLFNFELVFIVKHLKDSLYLVSSTGDDQFAKNNNIELTNPFVDFFWFQKSLLYIDNLQDDKWRQTFPIDTACKSYIGVSLKLPDDTIYGTLCVFSKRSDNYDEEVMDYINLCKDNIENHLRFEYENKLKELNRLHEKKRILVTIENPDAANLFSATAEVLYFDNNNICIKQFQRKDRINNGDDIINSNVYDLFPENIAALICDAVGNSEESKEIQSADFCTRINNVSNYYRVLFFRHSKEGYSVVVRDVNNRKKRELKLNILSGIIKNLKCGLLLLSPEGVVEFANARYCEIINYEAVELVGKPATIFMKGKHPSFFYKKIWHNVRLGNVWEGEINTSKKNGSDISLDASVVPVVVDGRLQQIIAICKDTTIERNMVEELAELTTKMLNSKNLHDAFFSNISHEIRTPINSIIGFSDLLKLDNIPHDKQVEFLEYIQKNSNILLNIIDEIVDAARIQAGNISVKRTKTPVNRVLDEVYTFFNNSIENDDDKKIKLKLHKEIKDYEFAIKTDRQRLWQILNNLLSNALKFTEEGVIEFGYKVETVTGIFIHFFVCDTGIGIPEDKLDLIFDRFGQVERPFERNLRGMGLGLPITKELIEILGGEIWVETKLGVGSTFHFTLPYNLALKDDQELLFKTEAYLWKDKTILVVDDEISNIEYYNLILHPTEAKLLFAKNGSECISVYQQEIKIGRIDIILMDIRMPIMDGIVATQKLVQLFEENKRPNVRAPRIIAQTAYTRDYEKAKSLKAGCTDFVTKPVKSNDLLQTINKYI